MKIIFGTIFSLFFYNFVFTQWTDFNPGISGDFKDIEISGTPNFICGNTGIFSSTDMVSWSLEEILNNPNDSIIFKQTIFNGLIYANNTRYACGKDTVNNTGVVFKYTTGWSLDLIGSTSFNDIDAYGSKLYVVGDNGAIFYNQNTYTSNWIDYSSNITVQNLNTVEASQYYSVLISGDSISMLNSVGTSNVWDSINNKSIKDMAYTTGNNFWGIEGSKLFNFSAINGWSTLSQINYPINANGFVLVGNIGYLGIENGILKTDNIYNEPWELQSSSLGNNIQEIVGYNNQAWAVGLNSTMIKTSNIGGVTIPFVDFYSPIGSCLDSLVTFENFSNTSYSYDWYIDNILVSNTFDLSYSFNTLGAHTVKLVVDNGTNSDSLIRTINILMVPDNTLSFDVSDTIICEYEESVFTIHNTENDVYYSLYSLELGTSTNFELGNGGDLSISTGIIPNSSKYLINSRRLFSDCSKFFFDTISIFVDHTKADFYFGLINAIPGENVNFYEQCNNATSYLWNFPSGSSISSSINPDETVSFTNVGNPLIELICSSDNNCYDTIQKLGTKIYPIPSNLDSCWVNLGVGDDPDWPGFYNPHISCLTETFNGYLVSGKRFNQIFPTQYGDSLYLNDYGSYLNQYDYNGVLKWSLKTEDATNTWGTDYEDLTISSTAIDQQGNIYACGYFKDYFIDNSGDTIKLDISEGVIFKLDSLGRSIWYRACPTINPIEVAVDNANQVYITYSGGGTTKYLFLNDSIVDTISAPSFHNYGILKLDQNGEFIWDIPINIDAINQSGLIEVQFDQYNNIYVAAILELSATIYSVNNSIGTTIPGIVSNYGGKTLIFKLNNNGELQWTLRSRTIGFQNDSTIPLDMVSDENGNLYVSGKNNCYAENIGLEHIFENTDGSITSSEVGEYFIAKLNSDGICQWIRGANNSYYGYGEQIDLDNDRLFVVGSIFPNNSNLTTVEFRNPSGSFVPLEIDRFNYFIGVYDTNGNIIKVIKNADNVNGTPFTRYASTGFFKKDDDSFYIATNGLNQNYSEFGTIMSTTNGREGWITKAQEDCGLVFNEIYENTTDIIICKGDDYTLPNGTTLPNIQSNISDTIIYTSILNIDSLVITNIELYETYEIYDTVQLCINSDYNFPDGTYVSNLIYDTIQTSFLQTINSCDSIIYSVLTIKPTYLIYDTIAICYDSSNTFPDGSFISNTVSDTTQVSLLQSTYGCDSIISTSLQIMPNYTYYDTISICSYDTFTFQDGTFSNNFTDTLSHLSYLQNINGCDSIINEVIIPIFIDNSITNNNSILFSNESVTDTTFYQWLNCNQNFDIIQGETNQSYQPQSNGEFAVEITLGNCTLISECIIIDFTGLDSANGNSITFFPNPVNDILFLQFNNTDSRIIEIFSIEGKLIQTIENSPDNNYEISVEDYSKGIYILKIKGNEINIFKFVKQ